MDREIWQSARYCLTQQQRAVSKEFYFAVSQLRNLFIFRKYETLIIYDLNLFFPISMMAELRSQLSNYPRTKIKSQNISPTFLLSQTIWQLVLLEGNRRLFRILMTGHFLKDLTIPESGDSLRLFIPFLRLSKMVQSPHINFPLNPEKWLS